MQNKPMIKIYCKSTEQVSNNEHAYIQKQIIHHALEVHT